MSVCGGHELANALYSVITYVPLNSEKNACAKIIASLALKVTLWRYPMHGIYRNNLS